MRRAEQLKEDALRLGAFKAAVVPVSGIQLDPVFRDICKANSCGMYGKCWMCPPDVGEIDEMMAELRTYQYAMVYQTVNILEDSFDFEGMRAAGDAHNRLARDLRVLAPDELHLGAGGCRICRPCAKATGESCRFPDQAMTSLEAYGIHVSKLAELAGMKYLNGQNTVTYFGAIFLK